MQVSAKLIYSKTWQLRLLAPRNIEVMEECIKYFELSFWDNEVIRNRYRIQKLILCISYQNSLRFADVFVDIF